MLSDAKLREFQEFIGYFLELLICPRIPIPIDPQMSRRNTSPRDRGNMGYIRQQTGSPQVLDNSEME